MSVTVYSTNSCPWCVKAKDFLKDNKVTFKEVNVAEDAKGLQDMEEKSGQRGVPAVQIGAVLPAELISAKDFRFGEILGHRRHRNQQEQQDDACQIAHL